MRISHMGHTACALQEGVFGGTPHAITQTADGYIWIGTDAGIVRFDGVRFVPWEPPDKRPTILPGNCLLGGRDGTLWIGTAVGLTALKSDRLINFSRTPWRVNAILEDHAGTVWVARSRTGADHAGGICQVVGGHFRCFGLRTVCLFPTPARSPRIDRGIFGSVLRMNCCAGRLNLGARISARS